MDSSGEARTGSPEAQGQMDLEILPQRKKSCWQLLFVVWVVIFIVSVFGFVMTLQVLGSKPLFLLNLLITGKSTGEKYENTSLSRF